MKSLFKNITALCLLCGVFLSSGAFACATCGCSLSSDGALGYSTTGGWDISLDDTFINQNQLRSGSSAISQQQAQAVSGQEVENQTLNRYLTFGLGYTSGLDWNFKLSIPYIERFHTTYAADPALPLSPDQLSSATANGIGDVKLVVSYQGLLASKNLGLQVGIKLPTGNYGGPSADNGTGALGQGSTGHSPAGFGPAGEPFWRCRSTIRR